MSEEIQLKAYHVIHLDVSKDIPLQIVEDLFKTMGVPEGFHIYRLIDSEGNITTVFDYPVSWDKEQCVEFMSKVRTKLYRLTQMFSEKGMQDLATKIATS